MTNEIRKMTSHRSYIPLLILFAILTIIWLIFALLVSGSAVIADKLSPILLYVSYLFVLIDISILIPLGFIKSSRPFAISWLYLSSFIFGLSVWMYAFVVTFNVLGLAGIFIGLILAGIGIIPLGIIASLLCGSWHVFFLLLAGIIFTASSRRIATYFRLKDIDIPKSSGGQDWITIDIK